MEADALAAAIDECHQQEREAGWPVLRRTWSYDTDMDRMVPVSPCIPPKANDGQG